MASSTTTIETVTITRPLKVGDFSTDYRSKYHYLLIRFDINYNSILLEELLSKLYSKLK